MKIVPVQDCGGSLNGAPPAPPAPSGTTGAVNSPPAPLPENAHALAGGLRNAEAAPVQPDKPLDLADEMTREKTLSAKEPHDEGPSDDLLEWVRNQPKPPLPITVQRNADGTFKSSGNPRGRPPKKERAFVPRQHTRDVLAVTEELITVQTPNGPVKLTAIVLALLKVRSKALAGHGPSLRCLIAMHLEALENHQSRHEFFSQLEHLERFAVFKPDLVSPSMTVDMNVKRKGTRDT